MHRFNIVGMIIAIIVTFSFFTGAVTLPKIISAQVIPQQKPPSLYPNEHDKQSSIPSPYLTEDGTEIITVMLKNGKYVFMPVTVEHGKPFHYSLRVPWVYGKDNQLYVSGDFPTLVKTGLHSEAELDEKRTITGLPVDVINYIGRPERFSGEGFMADDENEVLNG